jgi:hypothetical protein
MQFILLIVIMIPGLGQRELYLPTEDCAKKLEEVRPVLDAAPIQPLTVFCLRAA